MAREEERESGRKIYYFSSTGSALRLFPIMK